MNYAAFQAHLRRHRRNRIREALGWLSVAAMVAVLSLLTLAPASAPNRMMAQVIGHMQAGQ